MASMHAKAQMDSDARKSIDQSVATLIDRFGIEPLAPRRTERDGDLERIYQAQDFATLLDRLVKATEPADGDDAPVVAVKPKAATRKGGK